MLKFFKNLFLVLLAVAALLVAADAGYRFLSSNMHRYACGSQFHVDD